MLVFDEFDTDGDGEIGERTANKAVKAAKKEARQLFMPKRRQTLSKLDEDGDSELNKDERAKQKRPIKKRPSAHR